MKKWIEVRRHLMLLAALATSVPSISWIIDDDDTDQVRLWLANAALDASTCEWVKDAPDLLVAMLSETGFCEVFGRAARCAVAEFEFLQSLGDDVAESAVPLYAAQFVLDSVSVYPYESVDYAQNLEKAHATSKNAREFVDRCLGSLGQDYRSVLRRFGKFNNAHLCALGGYVSWLSDSKKRFPLLGAAAEDALLAFWRFLPCHEPGNQPA